MAPIASSFCGRIDVLRVPYGSAAAKLIHYGLGRRATARRCLGEGEAMLKISASASHTASRRSGKKKRIDADPVD